ncbi:MAG: hypothetical protein OEL20_19270 [Sulfuritalea sp.]|nr:hypothetical protein [Sulfuritalea sp.]
MSSIADIYINALLADASYALELADGQSGATLEGRLSSSMTPTLAKFISSNFSITSHNESDDSLLSDGSGFDATVWKGNTGTPYADKVYVSMQGTLGAQDFLSDISLATIGKPRAQLIEMINWWLRITTPADQLARQLTILIGGNVIVGTPTVGTGQLVGVTNVEVNGHSLGGFLASAFARIFGGNLNIDQVTTFNSPGFQASSEGVFASLDLLLQSGVGGFLNNVQTNVFAEHGLNVTTNSFFFDQIGHRQSVFNEEGTGIPNHSMYKLTDALALADVMSILDPSFSLQNANAILNAASAIPAKSLETILDALRKLAGTTDTTPTIVGDAGDSAASRNDYHQKLTSLRGLLTEDWTLRGTIISLATLSAADLQSAANNPDALAIRYALKELNPFAILGDNSLYTKFNTGENEHELDLYDTATGKGLSDRWIEDRARMLNALIRGNTADTTKVFDLNAGGTWDFEDRGSNQKVTLSSFGINVSDTARQKIIFGNDQIDGSSESLPGSDLADRLYGGAGADTLKGNAGDDYLEGGTGNDTLRGGKGNDIYRIDKNSGIDTLIDFAGGSGGDGLGTIHYNGEDFIDTLTRDGTVRNRYHSTTHPEFNIRFVGNPGERGDLIVIDPDGARFILKGWKSGELGLTLEDSPSTIQTTDLTGTDEGDNGQLTEAGHGATLTSTAANQIVYGLGGADLIELAHEGAIGYGGSGNDIITNGAGSQTLHGEEGNDILIASSGDDILDGGLGDDALQGGADDDLLDGGDGMDLLDGGSGADVIKGGTRDDFILGGGADELFGGAGNDYSGIKRKPGADVIRRRGSRGSRRWRDGGLAVAKSKSRRWGDGGKGWLSINDAQWRIQA